MLMVVLNILLIVSPQSHAPFEILIVDDDKVSRMTLERLLVKDGYRVQTAECGLHGLQVARSNEPDLILLDVVMPDLDGYTVCQMLRAEPGLAEVPILMITSLEDRASRVQGLEAGADDFITKPFHPEELRARVQSITRLNRYRRLRNERARFGWVVDQAEVGYLLVGGQGELLYANPKAQDLMGWTEEAWHADVLQDWSAHYSFHPEEDWQGFPHVQDGAKLFLWRPESEESGSVWLEVRVLHSGSGEHLIRLRDITEERSSQRSVWSLESVIGHKVRTPLTVANMGLTFLRKKAHKLSPDQVAEFAEQAYQGLESLKTELERVLSYVNSPRALPSPGDGFRLSELPAMAETVCSALSLDPLEQTFEEGLPEALQIDPRAFELLFWEALGNSQKFHPTGRPKLALRVSSDGTKIRIELSDDGRRLTPNQLQRAFEPYFQGEKGFTGQVPGMGLGLSTMRSLLWEVGGDCTLSNRTDGDGAVLRFFIPPADLAGPWKERRKRTREEG